MQGNHHANPATVQGKSLLALNAQWLQKLLCCQQKPDNHIGKQNFGPKFRAVNFRVDFPINRLAKWSLGANTMDSIKLWFNSMMC